MKKITIDNDTFKWLDGFVDRSMSKMKMNTSKYFDTLVFFEKLQVAIKEADTVKSESNKIAEPKANLCKDHPGYGASRPPRRNCDSCWEQYKRMNPMKYDKARKKFDKKNTK